MGKTVRNKSKRDKKKLKKERRSRKNNRYEKSSLMA